MKKVKLLLLLAALMFVTTASDCDDDGGGNPNLPNPGFTLLTVRINGLGIDSAQPFVDTGGMLIDRGDGYSGTLTNFRATSSGSGILPVANGVAPAFWGVSEYSGPCAGFTAFGGVKRADYTRLVCLAGSLGLPFGFSPLPIQANGPAVTWQIQGKGMNHTYGMPTVRFYNYIGTLVAQIKATQIASDNSWISGSSTALQALPSGSYYARVWNATSNGTGKFVGEASMRVYRPQPPPSPCGVQHILTDDGQQIDLPPPTCN
jgi:hypothetical protein